MKNQFTDNQKIILLAAWKDGWELMQNDGIFTPEMRWPDEEDKLNIVVFDAEDPEALLNHFHTLSPAPAFAVMQHCGDVVIDNRQRRCLVSRIKTATSDTIRILPVDQSYDFDDENILTRAEEVQPREAAGRVSYIFQSPFGNTRVTIAATNQQFDQFRKMIDHAKANGDWEALKPFINESNVNLRDGTGETILHEVVNHAPPDFIRFLLSKKADPNIANFRYGRTPAYYTNKIETHQLLMENGLNVNHQDTSGWTAGRYQMHTNGVLELYLQRGLDLSLKSVAGRTIAFDIIEQDTRLLKTLVPYGIDFNEPDNWGLTVLHLSILYMQGQTIGFLLEHGADPTRKTTKDYKFPIDEEGIIIPAGSAAKDIVRVMKTWRRIPGKESYIKDTADEFDIVERMIILKHRWETIEKEGLRKEQHRQERAKWRSDFVSKYQKNEGGFRRKTRTWRMIAIGGQWLCITGLIMLVLRLVTVINNWWGAVFLLAGLAVMRLARIQSDKLIKG